MCEVEAGVSFESLDECGDVFFAGTKEDIVDVACAYSGLEVWCSRDLFCYGVHIKVSKENSHQ